MLAIQKYLRSGKSLDEMEKELYIKWSACDEIPVVALNYNQIYADMSLPEVQECRGLYLEIDTWNVVCRAFDKFFNAHEGQGVLSLERFDWNSAIVMDKVDGSMVNCYNYKDEWYVGTRSSANASGSCSNYGMSFKDLILATMNEMGFSFDELDPLKYYIFELTTPLNKVVVPYEDYKLTLIGCRDAVTMREIPIWELPDITAPKVKRFNLNTMDEILSFVNTLNPTDAEGIVLMDKYFTRIKIKSEQYCAIHRAISYTETPRQKIGLLLCDDYDDIYGMLPKNIQEDLDVLKDSLNKLMAWTMEYYNSIKHYETQKDFALESLKHPAKAWLFEMRKGKSLEDCVKNTQVDNLELLLTRLKR